MAALLDALALADGGVVALCGAGGKSTLARAIGEAARSAGSRVVYTSTTHCGRVADVPLVIGDDPAAVRAALAKVGAAQVAAAVSGAGRVRGLRPEAVAGLRDLARFVIVEADGARGRALKAPGPHEPVLPMPCDAVVAVCSLAALGQPLTTDVVHRLERVLALSGRRVGSPIDLDVIAAAFGPLGYGGLLDQARRRVLVVAPFPAREAARALATRLAPLYARVVAGDARRGAGTLLALSSDS